jgi:hypothetical protein
MQQIGFFGWRIRLLLVVLALAAFGAAVTRVPLTTPRQRAEIWAAAHHPASMTLRELAAYPAAYRPAIFATLDAKTKSAIWKDQVRSFMATESHLTGQQRAFLENVLSQMTPEAFTLGRNSNECSDIKSVFPDKRAGLLAARNIGVFVTPQNTWRSTVATLSETLQTMKIVLRESMVGLAGLEGAPICGCYNNGYCECFSGGQECINNNDQFWVCNPTGSSCGCWWETAHACNGICTF